MELTRLHRNNFRVANGHQRLSLESNLDDLAHSLKLNVRENERTDPEKTQGMIISVTNLDDRKPDQSQAGAVDSKSNEPSVPLKSLKGQVLEKDAIASEKEDYAPTEFDRN